MPRNAYFVPAKTDLILKVIIILFPVDIVIAIYIPFIKLLLYIKRGQSKGLEVSSNLLKFVVNFINI